MPPSSPQSDQQRTRFVILGGYLGAGKTTLAAALARDMRDKHHKSVAIITNDQGNVLVDTAFMRNAGLDVREVLGGCFCSHFDEFIKSARSLVNMERPDLIIAEPIGTSTNILASVVVPLRDLYPDEFEVAPLCVVVDGTRVNETVKPTPGMGLAPARLIPAHQVHEAEVVIITKSDLMGSSQQEASVAAVSHEIPDAKVLLCSARTGSNLEQLESILLSHETSKKAALGVDQRLFNTEKATMGWYSGRLEVLAKERLDIYDLCTKVMKHLGSTLGFESVGHVKLVFLSDAASLKMSLVQDTMQVDGIKGGRYMSGHGVLLLNARVMAPPAQIREQAEAALRQSCSNLGLVVEKYEDSMLKPKPEVPDHFRT